MPHLSLSPQLTRRIEQNDIDYACARLGGMQQASGNPLNIEIRGFDGAVAYAIQGWPDFWYGNKVLGVNPSNQQHLNEMVAFFENLNLAFRIEIMPGNLNRELSVRLHRLGFCPMSYNTAMVGYPNLPAGLRTDHQSEVRPLQADEIDRFIDLYQEGFELPPLNAPQRLAVRAWLDHEKPNLYLCMALVDGEAAGVGVLYLDKGIALLADAATLPRFRGRGCHTALLHHRIDYAARNNNDLITSFVEFGSTSHQNLEKAGLRVAYTKTMWWKI